VNLIPFGELKQASALIVAVAHRQYRELSVSQLCSLMNGSPLIIDVKGIYNCAVLEDAGVRFWRL
jgi:UDP-N-acetyl-D-glucosamine/UDP-N-acetyl-D-galactosamine dehydrogenase